MDSLASGMHILRTQAAERAHVSFLAVGVLATRLIRCAWNGSTLSTGTGSRS